MTEWEMAERARSGDTEAFGELIRRHRQRAFGWAHSIAGDENLAEDIVQEAFVKAFLHVGQLVEPNRFLGWLRRIVKNEANMKLRRGGPYRRERPFSSFAIPGDHENFQSDEYVLERLLDRIDLALDQRNRESQPVQHVLRKESIRLIRSLLECLNERERGMFEAYFFLHCSADEIASLFHTTSGSVHTYLHRSKRKIQEAIRRERMELRGWNPDSMPLHKRSLSMPSGKPDVNHTFIDRIAKLLRGRGEQATLTELSGRSGHAFRLKLSQRTTYADGVFAFDWKREITEMLSVYGYEPEFLVGQLEGSPVPLHPVCMLFEVVQPDEELVAGFIRKSIDRGNPVLFFDTYVERPFVHEWNLIYSYNDLERIVEMTDIVPPYRKSLSYAELAASPLRFLCTVKKTNRSAQPLHPLQSLKAIHKYLNEGDSSLNQTIYTSYVSGLQAYTAWIRHLEAGSRIANAYGHRYMAYVYASSRSFAGSYLRSLAVERCVEGALEDAAAMFVESAQLLQKISNLSPLERAEQWSAEVLEKTIDLLHKVRESEANALIHLSEAVRILEAKSKQWEVHNEQ